MAKAKVQAKKTKKKVASKKAKVKAAPKKKLIKAKTKKVSAKKTLGKATKSTPKKSKPAAQKVVAKTPWDQFLKPLDDRILVKVNAEPTTTPSGIILPDSAQVGGNRSGQVLLVGRGHLTKKGKIKQLDVQIGDEVLFTEYSGTNVQLQGEDLKLLRESEILGIKTSRK